MKKTTPWNVSHLIKPLVMHQDPRGALFEILRFTSFDIPEGGQLYSYTVAPGARRGDHFHHRKREWFVCVHGDVRLFMKTKDGGNISEILEAEVPKLIYAGPGTSHAVFNEGLQTAVIVAYASKEFDPSDPDTFAAKAD